MGRSAVLERIDEEAELCHRLLRREAENLEHLFLKLAVMYTEGATAHFHTVAHEVVGHSAHFLRSGVKQGNIVRIGQREGMVGSHESLLLVAPLEEREVHNPQTDELILVAQAKTVAHF